MIDCEFVQTKRPNEYTCVVCGQGIYAVLREPYGSDSIHRNCPVELIEDINAGGVGTELHKLLLSLGADVRFDCKCARRIAVMNEKGSLWCRLNTELIVVWLRQAARERNLFSYSVTPRAVWNAAARRIVMLAIINAERRR